MRNGWALYSNFMDCQLIVLINMNLIQLPEGKPIKLMLHTVPTMSLDLITSVITWLLVRMTWYSVNIITQ